MDSIVDVDAGEDGEDVGLKEGHQKFERGQRDDHANKQWREEVAGDAKARQQRNEACEHRERDVARQHVGKQTHRMRDRPQKERENLDENDQRQDEDRNAGRHEQLEEFQAVLVEAVDQHGEEHQKRQRRGDDDVACNREVVGNDADANRISLLTMSTTSSIGVSAGTVTVTFPTIDAVTAARRSIRQPVPFGCEQANPIALAAN